MLDLGNGPWTIELWAKRDSTGTTTRRLWQGERGQPAQRRSLTGTIILVKQRRRSTLTATTGPTTGRVASLRLVTSRHEPRNNHALHRRRRRHAITGSGIDRSHDTPSRSTGSRARTAEFSDGSIDEVALYGRALTGRREVAAPLPAAANGTGPGVPTALDGAILRVDPVTGAGGRATRSRSAPMRTPAGSSPTASATRSGSRLRPGTNELWVGDVGWNTWEEINRIPTPTDAVVENFGWPCYEGVGRQSRLRRREPDALREPVRAGRRRGHGARLHLQPRGQGRRRRDLPDRQLLDLRHRVLPGDRRLVPGLVPRRPVLRRPQPQLHLVHGEGHERPARPGHAPDVRRRRGRTRSTS